MPVNYSFEDALFVDSKQLGRKLPRAVLISESAGYD